MDPQQRFMLEMTWHCLEDAGYAPSTLARGRVGVYIGVCNYDYKELEDQFLGRMTGHRQTGSWTTCIPNRVSYWYNFHGPSFPIDTGCSSSLLTVHSAIQSLRLGECDLALAGGVSLICSPLRYIGFGQLGMLSPTGRCWTFDAAADGYVRGEGAGLLLLKPLTKALEDGDPIYGVIRGSASNHGGKARTLTSPNAYAQTQVIVDAHLDAGVSPDTVTYIETHGTGTPLGDPIEIHGLKRAFQRLGRQFGVRRGRGADQRPARHQASRPAGAAEFPLAESAHRAGRLAVLPDREDARLESGRRRRTPAAAPRRHQLVRRRRRQRPPRDRGGAGTRGAHRGRDTERAGRRPVGEE
jgi:acyl transferase domain-containing protein